MIALFKNLGEWVEDDSYVPSAGDVIFYDWQDSGVGDNTGSSDHVGIVEKVSGSTITVIEGNYSDSVKRRTMQVNGKYIRGYGVPKYTDSSSSGTTSAASTTTTTTATDDKTIWNFFKGKGLNDFAIAGVMGNLYAESGLNPKNLQNTYEKKLGYTDAAYTAAVDNGSYTNFAKDSAGYGLAQWTYHTRKQALLTYAKSAGKSIGDLTMQLEYLWKELQGYTSVMKVLNSATSILEASNAILTGFEKPADQGTTVKNKRAGYGKTYYDKYAAKTTTTSTTSTTSGAKKTAADAAASYLKSLAGTYVTTAQLNCRNGAGTSKSVLVVIPKGTKVQNYGYYTAVSGVKWLYIQFTLNGTTYTGFASSAYLSKQ
jgi:hypothetical protein